MDAFELVIGTTTIVKYIKHGADLFLFCRYFTTKSKQFSNVNKLTTHITMPRII